MFNRRQPTEAALRTAARRQREEDADRLLALVPGLVTLEIALEERRAGSAPGTGGNRHVRRIVVERAPAVFDVLCSKPNCVDGGHDITPQIMAPLRQHKNHFEGSHRCTGMVGPEECGAELHFVGTATWQAADRPGNST